MIDEEYDDLCHGVVCPNSECVSYTLNDSIIAKGTYKIKDGEVQRYRCKDCKKTFNQNADHDFFKRKSYQEKVELIVIYVYNNLGVKGIAQKLTIPESSVVEWLTQIRDKIDGLIISNKP